MAGAAVAFDGSAGPIGDCRQCDLRALYERRDYQGLYALLGREMPGDYARVKRELRSIFGSAHSLE
jgi:hypothetical protein